MVVDRWALCAVAGLLLIALPARASVLGVDVPGVGRVEVSGDHDLEVGPALDTSPGQAGPDNGTLEAGPWTIPYSICPATCPVPAFLQPAPLGPLDGNLLPPSLRGIAGTFPDGIPYTVCPETCPAPAGIVPQTQQPIWIVLGFPSPDAGAGPLPLAPNHLLITVCPTGCPLPPTVAFDGDVQYDATLVLEGQATTVGVHAWTASAGPPPSDAPSRR